MFYTFMVLEKPQRNCNHFCRGSKIYKLLLLLYSLFSQNVQNVTQTCICPLLHSLVFLLPGTSYMPTLSYPWLFSSTHLYTWVDRERVTQPEDLSFRRLTGVYCLIQSPSMILNITQAHCNS